MTSGQFPVPQETVEAGLLHSCQSMAQWLELSVFTEDDFSSHRDIFRFYGNYLSQYGSLPSHSQVSTRFNWQPPVGDFQYWLAEMKRYSLARQVLSTIKEGYDRVSEPDVALNYLLEQLSLIRSHQSNNVQASDSDIATRYEKYLNRTKFLFNTGQIIGIKTGMKIIDNTKEGWIPGALVGVYSRPSVGKTWWLVWQGIQAWLEGKTVLLISPEMPANQIGLRLDLLWCQALGYPIRYSQLRVGDPSVDENYKQIVSIVSRSQRWWTYSTIDNETPRLGKVTSLIRQHNPDLVLIDGISLLSYEGHAQQTWEKMKDLCYGLKNIATSQEVPILITHQAVNTARGMRRENMLVGRGDDFHMPNLNDAAYGDAFVAACSDVITMCGDYESHNIIWYSIRKVRERGWEHNLPPRMALFTDFSTGRIIDLSEYSDNRDQILAEVRRLL